MTSTQKIREFEAVIGLEIHAQLSTETKIFCSCRARLQKKQSVSDVKPNINTCPVCTGQPGALPVINKKVIEYAVRAGLATGCKIRQDSVFARKNYFYPDLPKGYQISQYDLPICENGKLEIEINGTKKTIGIQRIHIEEDAGKNIHMGSFSLVNLNRAGVPLIEIVSNPDINSPEEAGAYMRALHALVTHLDVCDGNMQEGNFRCDANISVRPKGQEKLGTRAEIKNLNSFKFIERALQYEIGRQIEVIKAGKKIIQETRSFDSAKGVTLSMRSKEEAEDYRYFPDPDLMPIIIGSEWIEKIRKTLPELPQDKRKRFITEFALGVQDATELVTSRSVADYFENCINELMRKNRKPKKIAKIVSNLINGEVLRLLNEEHITLEESKLTPSHISDLVIAIDENILSSSGAKLILDLVWKTGCGVNEAIDEQGLRQVNDEAMLESAINEVIKEFAPQFEEYSGGKSKILSFLIGQVMKKTKGKANPEMLADMFKKKSK